MSKDRNCRDCGARLGYWKKVCAPCNFWSYVTKTATCWVWRGCRNKDGYGRIRWQGRTQSAHRISWMITHGRKLIDGEQVLHHCDNPPCVNPNHLWVGTISQNMLDAFKKARKHNNGEWNPHATLTALQTQQIRAQFQTGLFKRASLARQYGVNWSTIDRIIKGVAWRCDR